MSLRERTPGTWDVEVYGHARADGTRRRYTRRVHGGKRDALAAERDLYDQRDRQQLALPNMTVKAYMTTYLEARWSEHRHGNLAWATVDLEQRLADTHIVPAIGKRKMASVTPPLVRKLLNELTRHDDKPGELSGTTKQKVHKLLKAVWRQALSDGIVKANVAAAVRSPSVDTVEKKALTLAQARSLLQHLEQHEARERKGSRHPGPLRLVALFALTTGARMSEALSVKWPDVDTDAGMVRIRGTKTARSDRVVPLSAKLARELKTHRAAQSAMRLEHANLWHDEGFVFPSTSKYKDAPAGRYWSGFKQAWHKADTGVTFHQLRHTYVTRLMQGGVRDEVVSRAAGHASSNITRAVYSHVQADEMETVRKVVDTMA